MQNQNKVGLSYHSRRQTIASDFQDLAQSKRICPREVRSKLEKYGISDLQATGMISVSRSYEIAIQVSLLFRLLAPMGCLSFIKLLNWTNYPLKKNRLRTSISAPKSPPLPLLLGRREAQNDDNKKEVSDHH